VAIERRGLREGWRERGGREREKTRTKKGTQRFPGLKNKKGEQGFNKTKNSGGMRVGRERAEKGEGFGDLGRFPMFPSRDARRAPFCGFTPRERATLIGV
jgi:hypothetical protein